MMMIIAGDGKANVYGVNSLDVTDWQNSDAVRAIGPFGRDVRDGDFEIVMTNPPFAGKISGRTQLAAFELFDLATKGELGSEDEPEEGEQPKIRKSRKVPNMKRDVLFLERCLTLLKPGGRMAIVLPQGNLNNTGMKGLRTWITAHARLLAVVGLHVNTFKPFTGTKTSVVFLQKWGGDAGPGTDDYQVFMASSQRSGKDNSGNYVFKRDPTGNLVDEEGKPVAETGRRPAIDHDLTEIAREFNNWSKSEGLSFAGEEHEGAEPVNDSSSSGRVLWVLPN